MPQEKMTQDDIDRLVTSNLFPEEVDISSVTSEADTVLLIPKNKTMLAMLKRLEFARENLSFEDQKEARKALHCAAFDLWLARRRMGRSDYSQLINRELKKHGYPPFFKV